MEQNKGLIMAGAALAVMAVLVLTQFITQGDDPVPETTGNPGSTASAVVQDPGVGSPDGPEGADGSGDASTSPADASDPSADASEEAGPEQVSPKGMKVPPGALRTAKAGIRAYTEYSYKDAAHNAWLARLRKVSTPAFEHSMVEMFGNDDEGQALWYEEVVPTKRETRTEVRTAVIDDGFYTNTPNRMTFVVTFATAVRSTETGGKWTSPDDRTMWVTVVRKGARWLVDEIKSTANRS